MKIFGQMAVVKKNKYAQCCFGNVGCVGKEAELQTSFYQLLSRFVGRVGSLTDKLVQAS